MREATIPTTPGCQCSWWSTIAGSASTSKHFFHELLGVDEGVFVDLPPVPVLFFEDLCEGGRFRRVVAGEHADRAHGIAEPARGIDARRKREHDLSRRDPAGFQAGGFDECLDARPGIGVDGLQSDFHQNTVLPGQRDDVGGACERDKIQILSDHRFLVQASGDAMDQFEADAAAAERLEGVGIARFDRVEDGHGFREDGPGFMVVADDHVEPGFARVGDLLDRGDAAIDGDEHADAPGDGVVDSLPGNPVPFLQAIGDVVLDLSAHLLQEQIQHSGAVRSVDVIVAEHEEAFSGLQCPDDAFRGAFHSIHEKRIVEEFQCRPEVPFRAVVVRYPAVDEDFGDRFGDVDFPRECGDEFCIGGIGEDPPVLSRCARTPSMPRCVLRLREQSQRRSVSRILSSRPVTAGGGSHFSGPRIAPWL